MGYTKLLNYFIWGVFVGPKAFVRQKVRENGPESLASIRNYPLKVLKTLAAAYVK